MKQKIILFLFSLLLFAFPQSAFATVGGPQHIDRISYNADENAIYYIFRDGSGRGCPPEVYKIDVENNQKSVVYSCDEILKTYYVNGEVGRAEYEQLIADFFKDLSPLSVIGLQENNIDVKVMHLGITEVDEYEKYSNFKAIFFQDNKEIDSVEFTGCYEDQPNVFTGFLIPNSNKIAIEISRIGDCFEGGYAQEDLYFIINAKIYDPKAIRYDIDSNYDYSGITVGRGDLIAHSEKVSSTINFKYIIMGIIVLAVGFGAGFFVKKMRSV